MKLIVIYGPPAVGKLTVARELEKTTNFKIFHNHLTGDIASTIYEFNSEPWKKYVIKQRKDFFKEAAKSNANIIFTYVYGKGIDESFIKWLTKNVKSKKANEIYFVQLKCNKKELEKRVVSPQRKKYEKLKSKKGLRECFKKWDMESPLPLTKVIINNTKKSPKETAKKIKQDLKLK